MNKEPAVIAAVVAAIVNAVALLAFKHELSQEEQAGIVTVVTVIAGVFIRQQVTPVP